MADHDRGYEFGYMDRREKLKVTLLKLASFAWIAIAILALVVWADSTSAVLTSAGAIVVGAFFYINLCTVRTEVAELFEPPYPLKGQGLGIIVAACLFASIYFSWIGR